MFFGAFRTDAMAERGIPIPPIRVRYPNPQLEMEDGFSRFSQAMARNSRSTRVVAKMNRAEPAAQRMNPEHQKHLNRPGSVIPRD